MELDDYRHLGAVCPDQKRYTTPEASHFLAVHTNGRGGVGVSCKTVSNIHGVTIIPCGYCIQQLTPVGVVWCTRANAKPDTLLWRLRSVVVSDDHGGRSVLSTHSVRRTGRSVLQGEPLARSRTIHVRSKRHTHGRDGHLVGHMHLTMTTTYTAGVY